MKSVWHNGIWLIQGRSREGSLTIGQPNRTLGVLRVLVHLVLVIVKSQSKDLRKETPRTWDSSGETDDDTEDSETPHLHHYPSSTSYLSPHRPVEVDGYVFFLCRFSDLLSPYPTSLLCRSITSDLNTFLPFLYPRRDCSPKTPLSSVSSSTL